MLSNVPTRCPCCDGPLVAIALTLDGDDLTMGSCSRCDRRYWKRYGEMTELANLLGRDPLRQPALR